MIETNKDLRAFNTFGVPSVAERYLLLQTNEDLLQLPALAPPTLVLGSGSNLLLQAEVPGLTLHMGLGGINVLDKQKIQQPQSSYDTAEVKVRVGAGVNWQQFVLYALEQGWHGLENLSLIPGTVGAAPVQNIGAYGVEVAERIVGVEVYEYGKGMSYLTTEQCAFAYRSSRFKEEPGRYLITSVDFRLGGLFQANFSYGAIKDRLALMEKEAQPSPLHIARAVMEIRAEKLPFYSQLGNSGSFFKNPIVSQSHYAQLLTTYPDLPAYPVADDSLVKLPAGWLIDRAGWRGKRIGNVGCYQHQALVIVNHGGATGKEILAFSETIQSDISTTFGVELEREVQLVGSSALQGNLI